MEEKDAQNDILVLTIEIQNLQKDLESKEIQRKEMSNLAQNSQN